MKRAVITVVPSRPNGKRQLCGIPKDFLEESNLLLGFQALSLFISYIEENVDQIKFEIFDEKSFTDDELIAVVKYPIPQVLYTQGFIDEWLPLSGKLGEQKEGSLNIRIVFTVIIHLKRTLCIIFLNI